MAKKKIEEQISMPADISFEKALNRLERIVEEMEGGTLSLEDMMQRFEEGQGLVKICSTKLNQVERKIELLIKEDETVKTAPFDKHKTDDDSTTVASSGDLPF